MSPKNDHQWQQLFLSPSCSPIPWGSNKRDASISQAQGLQLEVTTCCEIWHIDSKSRHGTVDWAVCLRIAGSQGSTQKRKKKTNNKPVKKMFFHGAAWSMPNSKQMCGCRQLCHSWCGMPATSWLEEVSKQGVGMLHRQCSKVPAAPGHPPSLPTSIWELMIGSVMPSFFWLFPFLLCTAVSSCYTTSFFIFRFTGSCFSLGLTWELILHCI